MKKVSLIILTLVSMLVLATASFAQSAHTTTWNSAIVYFNPTSTAGTLSVSFYRNGQAEVTSPSIPLAAQQSGTLLVSSVSGLSAGFEGGAVLSSDVQIIATSVQLPASPLTYTRHTYNGFTTTEAATSFFVPTFINTKWNTNSTMGVQNIESSAISVDIKAYATGASSPTSTTTKSIDAQASVILDGSDLGLPSDFTGSILIDGTGTSGGRVVASVYEADISGRNTKAFQGVAAGSNTVYMATMICDKWNQISYYAIQNADLTSSASVSIVYYNTAGTQVATTSAFTLSAGAKSSINPCSEGVPAGTSGSAVITSTGAPIISVGKATNTSSGMQTAFMGEPAGQTKSGTPYIRWASTDTGGYRSYLAIMNVGSTAATNVKAKYYNQAGTLIATDDLTASGSLGQFIKVNSNPSTAGSTFTGAVIIESDQPVVVVVRNVVKVGFSDQTQLGDDYNGKSVP